MANHVVQDLMRLIDERGFVPGDRIPAEQELCERLGVSRPVVREAISVLETMGILVARKGSGRVLRPFDFGAALGVLAGYAAPRRKWLLDLLAVREALEGQLLATAAPGITPETFVEIEAVTATMERRAAAGEYFGEEDRRFHALLYRSLDNDVLQGLLDFFWKVYEQLDVGELAHAQRLDETAAHHRRILEALRAGDVRRAQHHLNAHFYDTGFSLSGLPGDASETLS